VLAVFAPTLLGGLRWTGTTPLVPAAILAAASAMKMLPPAVLWILISHRCGQYF
jgi:hypothetical protein